jgi:hypothetical protein
MFGNILGLRNREREERGREEIDIENRERKTRKRETMKIKSKEIHIHK